MNSFQEQEQKYEVPIVGLKEFLNSCSIFFKYKILFSYFILLLFMFLLLLLKEHLQKLNKKNFKYTFVFFLLKNSSLSLGEGVG